MVQAVERLPRVGRLRFQMLYSMFGEHTVRKGLLELGRFRPSRSLCDFVMKVRMQIYPLLRHRSSIIILWHFSGQELDTERSRCDVITQRLSRQVNALQVVSSFYCLEKCPKRIDSLVRS
jgi:hypothetical protein